ncbi:glycoside hydrolase family 97 protein [Arcticibacter eurypsychrophilus]|uniref:glycoside hydrolase family 97 protein n=1 Tax=Arcticibacter eurypsychrophilus TaxID=1434752 RepID=UPI00084CF662|nr:glycoside hydrolase family 97 protein [Arcticibacter eurypsychrophilus]
MKKLNIILILSVINIFPVFSQKNIVRSPNQKISVELISQHNNTNMGEWYLKASSTSEGKNVVIIPRIDLGLIRSDQKFSDKLKFLKASKQKFITDRYTSIHGKRAICSNSANEVIVSFENPNKSKLNIILRAYNDGIIFRYEFPEKKGSFVIKDELTSYIIPRETKRWMEKWNTANEGLYSVMSKDKVQKQEWGYPALFQQGDSSYWYLLHEADLNQSYCGTKLSNKEDSARYKLTFPNPRDGRGIGSSTPTIALPWKSPWRVIIIGSLSDIVGSTLVDDVSEPSKIKNPKWIKPGVVSWNYWSSNHGTKDYKIVTDFADLAAEMNWPYTLLDWEWDAMTNGGNVEDATKYILSKGVKPLIWYNSGGNHTWVSSTPKDRMLTHQNRVEEFSKLRKMGFVGVKIDFFESEKQDMIKYYIDILEDAAKFEMMVYFHGCLVPRGWARTYPNLMTYEGVRGAEWYNNGPEFTLEASEHNTILPFTRNVVGAMDYTPTTFTNSQFPHLTSYGHELALSIVFESGLQHFADRPDGYLMLPDVVKSFLKSVPNAWDDTRLIDGYPGEDAVIARRKGTSWYIGGINAEIKEKQQNVKFPFLQNGIKYKCTLIADGKHDKDFEVRYYEVDMSSAIDVKLLRRGGFVMTLVPTN